MHTGDDENAANQSDKIAHDLENIDDKDVLNQQDMINEVETFRYDNRQRKVLETEEGKNNGALPAAYQNQRTNHP